MKEFKHFDINLLKIGKISRHKTQSKGKSYSRGKLYLRDNLAGEMYELYDLGDVGIQEHFGTVDGKGLLIFIPRIKRPKEKIGRFGEWRAGNRCLSRIS